MPWQKRMASPGKKRWNLPYKRHVFWLSRILFHKDSPLFAAEAGKMEGEAHRMYEEKSPAEVMRHFATGGQGLTREDAEERLRLYGNNTLQEPERRSLPARLWSQLCDSLIFVLFAAAGISVMLGEFSDAAVILAVVVLNAVVGVIQEGRAEKALESLKQLTRLEAVVIRDGKEQEIDAGLLVPGDLVVLDTGRQVPADLRLIETNELKTEESALTGESVPVRKNSAFRAKQGAPLGERKNMAFMTSYVTAGRGLGIVTATGMQTEIGRIAAMIHESPEEETPLQKRLSELGRVLSLTAIGLCALLFGMAVLQKRDVLEMLITAISLAVAAVPEGLPAVVTIVLALSVTRMAKLGTIVRRLPSVETLGAVSVVCSDKTGTLTKNEMTVTACYCGGNLRETSQVSQLLQRKNPGRREEREEAEDLSLLLEAFCLCNDATEQMGEPTELALYQLGKDCGADPETVRRQQPRQGELPFSSERKRMTTFHRSGSSLVSYTKGAPDVILERCSHIRKQGRTVAMDAAEKKRVEAVVEQLSSGALRVLAAAMTEGRKNSKETEMTFLGLAGMMDPPREEAREAVEAFRRAGVRTIMITGDHAKTACAVAAQLGIGNSRCLTGEQLDGLSDEELRHRIPTVSVFARVSPAHKVRIVRALRSLGHITAMTGDGVNDAPSLKIADIGIAMGKNGTDVARQASDMILTDDNFATIERAIEEGRGIYENIRKSVIFLLSSNLGEIITMFAAVAAGVPSPLKACHILWVNLITDSLPALALGMDENDREQLMRRPPRRPEESLFAGGGWFCTVFYGAVIAAVSLGAFFFVPWKAAAAEGRTLTFALARELLFRKKLLVHAQTYAFTVLGLSELFHAIGMRSPGRSVFCAGLFSNRLMWAAFFCGLLLQAAVTELPWFTGIFCTASLSLKEWAGLFLTSAIPLTTHELLTLPGTVKEKGHKKSGPF